MKLDRPLVILGADIVVAPPHAEGMLKQTLAHPASLPVPPKEQTRRMSRRFLVCMI